MPILNGPLHAGRQGAETRRSRDPGELCRCMPIVNGPLHAERQGAETRGSCAGVYPH